jgi:hypothetical protein
VRIGVTGTRSGMTADQRAEVGEILKTIGANSQTRCELHHGDCVGVDAEVANMARDLGFEIHCHPPEIDDLRAFTRYNVIYPETSYFARNRRIVHECELLLVVPWQRTHQKSGGTWYTHDYALKVHRAVELILPLEERSC